MELFGALCALYALECVVWLPRGAALFAATRFGTWIASGPGFRLLPPRPAARCQLAMRFALVERDGRLYGRGGTRWLARDSGDPVSPSELCGAEAHGRLVRAGPHELARAADRADAERIARALRDIAGAEPNLRRERVDAALRESLSIAALRGELARFETATRGLAWASDLYALSLFGFVPAAALWSGSEYALWKAGPVLAALHLAALLLFARAHARLHPERRGERLQALFGAALYPPGLLRAHHHLRTSALAGFHPAAAAAAVLPPEASRAFLRAELAHANARADAASPSELGFSPERCERDALEQLCADLGEAPASLLRAPARRDALALGYCPACLCEYRRGGGHCSDCGVALQRYPEPAAAAADR